MGIPTEIDWRRRGVLTLGVALSLVWAACGGASVGERSAQFTDHQTLTLLPGGGTQPEAMYVVGQGHRYQVGARVVFADDVMVDKAATEVSVLYLEPGSGSERLAPASQAGGADTYVFTLPGSDQLGLCEGLRYAWQVSYQEIDGTEGGSFGDWREIMPAQRRIPDGPVEFLACADVRFEDVDGSAQTEAVPISVIRLGGGGCEYRLEFNNPDWPTDFAVHEVGGDPGEDPQRVIDDGCGGRPEFVSRDHDRQTVYYWTMLARQYAVDHLWVTPRGWEGGPINHAPDPVGPNVLDDAGMDTACFLTPGDPGGCFRAWPDPEGNRIYLAESGFSIPTVIHEYGHYAAGFVFGFMDAVSGLIGLGGFNPAKCDHRAYQEAIAEAFMSLVLHDARGTHYRLEDPLTNGVPHSSFDLVGADRFDNICGENDYEMGRPFVQAFHETLWDDAWSTHQKANDSMANAFTTALAANRSFRTDDLAGLVLAYLEEHHSAEFAIAADIFRDHGFGLIGDACAGNDHCSGPRSSRCDLTVEPHLCIPDDGWGKRGDYCTHNNQCDARDNLVCRTSGPGESGTCRP